MLRDSILGPSAVASASVCDESGRMIGVVSFESFISTLLSIEAAGSTIEFESEKFITTDNKMQDTALIVLITVVSVLATLALSLFLWISKHRSLSYVSLSLSLCN